VSASRYWRSTGDRRSVHGAGAGPVGAPPVCLQYRLQRPGEDGEVAVVDAAVVQLAGELAEQQRPVSPGEFEGNAYLDPSLDHLDGGSAGGRSSRLFPGPMPAGGRAPLRDWSPASGRERPTAPTASRCGASSRATVGFGAGPLWQGLFSRRTLDVQTPLALALPPSISVGTPAVCHADDPADGPPVTRHHDFRNCECKTCDGPRS
jgi:hypothetical protein